MTSPEYKIEFDDQDDYIHARVTGTNGPKTVAAYLDDIRIECQKRDCQRVLIEEHLDGPRLDTMDVFSVVSEGAIAALGAFEAIAYVDEKANELMEFAEDVAVNRGMPVAIFDSVQSARKWLREQTDGASVFTKGPPVTK